jgi:hypothetical protein
MERAEGRDGEREEEEKDGQRMICGAYVAPLFFNSFFW